MAELGEEARKAGYVVSDEMLNAYGKRRPDSVSDCRNNRAVKNALGTVLLPVLTDLAGSGVDLLGEFTNGILNANGDISQMGKVIGDILPKAIDVIMEYVPVILDLIFALVTSIGKAIVDNLPMIVSSATQIILSILEGLVSALPRIAEGALMLVSELAMGIINNLPMILETAIR